MLQAEMQAGAIKATSGGHHLVFVILILACLGAAWVDYSSGKKLDANILSQQQFTRPVPNDIVTDMIEVTLRKVASELKRKVDVNGDKQTNCVDAAVLFYQYYPRKNEVCIELNYNTKTGMNHLFNCVLIKGVWVAIEPQSAFGNKRSYYMRDVWKKEYDPAYNEDVTEQYRRFVK
jgi:hypothetical protein